MQERNLSKKPSVPAGAVTTLKRPDHISHSQIKDGRCLYRYMLRRLLGKYRKGNAAMREGSIMHDVIYEYTKNCVEQKMESDFELMTGLIENHFAKSELPESVYQGMRSNLLDYAERGIEFEKILDYEKKFHVKVFTGTDPEIEGELFVDGRMDRINCYRSDEGSVLEIIDFKNQMNIMSQEDVESDDQLRLYRYVAATIIFPGYSMIRSGIQHTRYKNFIRWTKMKTVMDCSQEFENTEAWLIRNWKRMIQTPDDQYAAHKCEACWEYGGCEIMLAGKCPVFKPAQVKKMKEGPIEDRVRVARKLKLDLAKIEEGIRNHFKHREPIEVDGSQVGYFPSASYKYLLAPFVEFANENGLALAGMTLSKSDAERTIKKKLGKVDELPAEMMIEIEKIRKESMSNRFKY